jgi:hypothetical protein
MVNSLQQQQNKGSEASTRHGFFFVSGANFGFAARKHLQTCKTEKQRKLKIAGWVTICTKSMGRSTRLNEFEYGG